MPSRLPIVVEASSSAPELTDPVPFSARGRIGVPGWLSDRQGRRLRYLRLSVTDRCDLRCTYCMPAEGAPASAKAEVLTLEELARICKVFHHLGVQTVRLTGGEPLLRKNLPSLVAMIRDEVGIADIALTTNATALDKLAGPLFKAGVSRINISLDSLRPEVFGAMTRGGDLARVLAGIDAAQKVGFSTVKINSVVVRGSNDDQLPEIVEWAWARGIQPRFIELMPIGAGAWLGRGAVVPVAEMKQRLSELIEIDVAPELRSNRGPAGYFPARDGSGRKVGFIGAVTENFCERCNRVRVTAKGEIRACLASPEGVSLKAMLRDGADDAAIGARVEEALFGKDIGHHFDGSKDLHHQVAMSRVGG